MKYVTAVYIVALCCTFSFVTTVPPAQAEDVNYVPLAPIANVNPSGATSVNVGNYMTQLFKLAIGIAAGLAVMRIAYAGIKYMLSDVITQKSDAVQMIKNAVGGLLLALCAWLILYTIGGDSLTNLNFNSI